MITSTLKKMRPQRPHLAYLVVLLVCSFGLTGVIAYQAIAAARGEREASISAVLGYIDRSAEEFDRSSSGALRAAFTNAFAGIFDRFDEAGTPLDSTAVLEGFNSAYVCDCINPASILGTHHYDFHREVLTTSGTADPAGIEPFLVSELPSNEQRAGAQWGFTFFTRGGPDARAVLFIIDHPSDRDPRHAYGIEITHEALRQVAEQIWAIARPPAAIADSAALPLNASAGDRAALAAAPLMAARMLLHDGTPIFATPHQFESAYTKTRHLSALGLVTAEFSLNPGRVGEVLAGGVPDARQPMLFAVLAITFAMMVVAILLIRREADITRLRSDFIAGVSHELRTPLAQIRMFAETLMLGRVRTESERQRSLEIIDQEARRLAHLVENVLLFARSERRRSRINTELTDLTAHLTETIQGFAVLCRTRDIELRPELQEGVIAPVDQGALRQILLNLLDNAVKYGPLRQRITVGLALFEDHARIWVDDEGPGIPESERASVFQSFFRLGRDIDSAVAGSGIGLAIVRELAILHGGRAWADEAPTGGARVVVELPGAYVRPDIGVGGWAVA
jgi:signal transduction histidine kinase